MAKILLVEDDSTVAATVADWLEFEHHLVEQALDGIAALELVRTYEYDLIILDWQLPGVSGLEICREYRSSGGAAPIIMLTGKDTSQDKTTGLDTGADDYLTKPFDLKELSARVRALLRRSPTFVGDVLKAGELSLDVRSATVTRGSSLVQLLPREYALLEFLMRHQNQIFSTDALLDRVWMSDTDATPEALRQCVSRLRKKIDVEGQPSLIRNVPGLGYKLEASG